VPGAAPSGGAQRGANGFSAARSWAPPGAPGRPGAELAAFEDIYAQARPGRPPGWAPERGGGPSPLAPFLHVRPTLAHCRRAHCLTVCMASRSVSMIVTASAMCTHCPTVSK
jgi:hypothetical protein